MKHIFVALSTFAKEGQEPLKMLEASKLPFTINTTGRRLTAQEVVALGKEAQGIVAGIEPYDASVLSQMPNLKCISRCGVGLDNIDLPKAKEYGIAVLNTPDVIIQPVAELTIAMIFDLLRHLTAHTTLMRQGQWQKITGGLLAGRLVGIVGLGRIGRRVAEMLIKLEAKVLAYDISPDEDWCERMGIKLVSLDQLLSGSDIVSLHATVIESNAFCLNKAHFSRMKKGALLINVARGCLVNETDLHDALLTGHLGGAGLDVFCQEPYQGPLAKLPNVVLTPHAATLTKESRLQMEIEAVGNLLNHWGIK